MKLGIVGLPNVGKSTLFNSLTKAGAESANYPFCTIDPNVGVVAVPDERLNKLAALYNSAKITPAVIEFVDIAGLVKGASQGAGLGNKFLENIRRTDAIVHVVRCFDDENIMHVVADAGTNVPVDPLGDIETIDMELILADLEMVNRRVEKAAKAAKELGFDGIQLHCAHGYLLSQFLDPTTNLRTDDYGGSTANRFRFPGECLTAIRQAVGQDYPVLVKVNTNCAGEADEAYAQDILYFCRQFEALGADAIELSGYNWLGLGKKKVPTFYLDRAKAIRQAVKIPLILVGGVRGPESAQAILDAGIDFVSASRPFICQPDFVQHLEKGEDSPCIGCTKCLGNIWAKEGRRCVKHPIPPEFATQA